MHRSANIVAHLLARAVSSISGSRKWQESAPDLINLVIISESLN